MHVVLILISTTLFETNMGLMECLSCGLPGTSCQGEGKVVFLPNCGMRAHFWAQVVQPSHDGVWVDDNRS